MLKRFLLICNLTLYSVTEIMKVTRKNKQFKNSLEWIDDVTSRIVLVFRKVRTLLSMDADDKSTDFGWTSSSSPQSQAGFYPLLSWWGSSTNLSHKPFFFLSLSVTPTVNFINIIWAHFSYEFFAKAKMLIET